MSAYVDDTGTPQTSLLSNGLAYVKTGGTDTFDSDGGIDLRAMFDAADPLYIEIVGDVYHKDPTVSWFAFSFDNGWGAGDKNRHHRINSNSGFHTLATGSGSDVPPNAIGTTYKFSEGGNTEDDHPTSFRIRIPLRPRAVMTIDYLIDPGSGTYHTWYRATVTGPTTPKIPNMRIRSSVSYDLYYVATAWGRA